MHTFLPLLPGLTGLPLCTHQAYGYKGAEYSIFNGVFDWTDGSWRTSAEVYTVQPGSYITSSVVFNGVEENSYTMIITDGTQTITTPYKIEAAQHKNESTAYFVLEHQPSNCRAYPKDGECQSSEHLALAACTPSQSSEHLALAACTPPQSGEHLTLAACTRPRD